MRGGFRVNSGRKPGGEVVGFAAAQRIRTESRQLLSEMVGTDKDPVVVAAQLYTDPTVPLALRCYLVLGMARYFHPALSMQAIQSTTTHVHTTQEALATKTALLLEAPPGSLREVNPQRELELLAAQGPTLQDLGFDGAGLAEAEDA